jgi:glycosyltransferase involved in cell wall biosynthesis
MTPLVSILIPAYNSEKWIEETIKSAVNQSWYNKEIIIVDDGSEDNTYDIAKLFESKNVKIVKQINQGASTARNKALSFAQGDFIQWLDADDLLSPDKIELHFKNNDRNPNSKVLHSSAWGSFFFSQRRAKFKSNTLWQDLSPLEWLLKHLGEGYYMYPAAWLVPRKLTELVGPWDVRLSYNDDGEYFCRLVALSEEVKFHRSALSFHRIGNLTSLSRSLDNSTRAITSLYLSAQECVSHLLNFEESSITKNACVNYLNRINHFFEYDEELLNKNQKRIIELGGNIRAKSDNLKFRIAQKIFGHKNAKYIKIIVWQLEILVHKSWDKILSIFSMGNKL